MLLFVINGIFFMEPGAGWLGGGFFVHDYLATGNFVNFFVVVGFLTRIRGRP